MSNGHYSILLYSFDTLVLRKGRGDRDMVIGTRRRREIHQSVGKARERENEEMVGGGWHQNIVGTIKPLVPRNY
jgi:hypothetical protein